VRSISVVRGILVAIVGAALMLAIAASQPVAGIDALATLSGTITSQDSGDIVWGKVPYCSCLITSATANVALALKDAKLNVNLKELSPRDGWLYFVAIYDPQSATRDQVMTAMTAGGAEVLAGPP
jgi:hypothetical protein